MNSQPDGTRQQPESQRPVPAFSAGDPVPGLSSWLLERKLGGGGFGQVWLARHALNKYAPRAVKFCTDPDARHRLVTHEKNVVARVMQHAGDHPNIVPLLEYSLDAAVPWLMYEYVEGGTLSALAEEWQALPLAKRLGRAVKVLHAVAGALAAMHRLNPPIVHRDLKPANILMAGAVPRITDFGIGSVALAEDGKDAQTARLPTEMLRSGTKLYASPEQRFGAQPSPTADVFALGVIAYQFISNDRYSQPGTDALTEMRDQKVPAELASLIVQSTAFKPERRPKDAGEWEVALGALLARFRSPSEASAGSVLVLVAESVSVPGLGPTTGPPPLPNTSSPSEPYVVPTADTGRSKAAVIPTEIPNVERVENAPPKKRRKKALANAVDDERPKGRRWALACVVVILAVIVGAFALALSTDGKKPEEVARRGGQSSELLRNTDLSATLPANPKAGEEFEIEVAPGTKMRFCYIPAGECQLGSPKPERDLVPFDTSDETEEKRGKFSTKGFWMGKYEVTQSEWAAVMRGTAFESPSEFRIGGAKGKAFGTIRDTSRFPVENVSWGHCQDFVKRASAHRASLGDKGAFDLPHEDEWEYACRGGLGNKRPYYFGGALNGTQANCDGNFPFGTTTKGEFLKRPQPVGSYETKALHPWGLCDMHGNVWEWCRNSYGGSGSRVLRGGSWSSHAAISCRAAHRGKYEPAHRISDLGFRVICTNR